MVDMKFRICTICGNMVGMIHSSGVPIICCGEEMKEIIPNSVDASKEKHVPDVTIEGDMVSVKVGSAPHPMLPEHHIEWVYVQTDRGGERKNLSPGDEPSARFGLKDEKALAVFAYCDLHGLWVKEL